MKKLISLIAALSLSTQLYSMKEQHRTYQTQDGFVIITSPIINGEQGIYGSVTIKDKNDNLLKNFKINDPSFRPTHIDTLIKKKQNVEKPEGLPPHLLNGAQDFLIVLKAIQQHDLELNTDDAWNISSQQRYRSKFNSIKDKVYFDFRELEHLQQQGLQNFNEQYPIDKNCRTPEEKLIIAILRQVVIEKIPLDLTQKLPFAYTKNALIKGTLPVLIAVTQDYKDNLFTKLIEFKKVERNPSTDSQGGDNGKPCISPDPDLTIQQQILADEAAQFVLLKQYKSTEGSLQTEGVNQSQQLQTGEGSSSIDTTQPVQTSDQFAPQTTTNSQQSSNTCWYFLYLY